MITIIAVPKAFSGKISLIQKGAVKSWLTINPRPEIILLGNESGISQLSRRCGLKHVRKISRNGHGTPLLDQVFTIANRTAKNKIVLYINCDIILENGVIETIKFVSSKFNRFLIVGRRYEESGILKGPSWIDYFIFTKGLFKNIPPFAIGRTFWDKWLIWYAKINNYPIIDATETIIVLHQSHSYSKNGTKYIWEGDEALNNIKLAGGWAHGCTISDADYKLTKDFILVMQKKQPFYIFINKIKMFIDKIGFVYPFLLKIRYWKNKIQLNFPKEEN